MKSIWTQIVTGIVLRQKNRTASKKTTGQDKDFKKRLYEASVTAKYLLIDALLIIFGIFSAGFGLKSFLLPNQFIDGGATGISLLITEISGVSLSLLIIAVNIPFIIFGYKVLGRKFVLAIRHVFPTENPQLEHLLRCQLGTKLRMVDIPYRFDEFITVMFLHQIIDLDDDGGHHCLLHQFQSKLPLSWQRSPAHIYRRRPLAARDSRNFSTRIRLTLKSE